MAIYEVPDAPWIGCCWEDWEETQRHYDEDDADRAATESDERWKAEQEESCQ